MKCPECKKYSCIRQGNLKYEHVATNPILMLVCLLSVPVVILILHFIFNIPIFAK